MTPNTYSVAVSFRGSGLDVDVAPILYDGDSQWYGELVSQDDGSRLRTSIPLHLAFTQRRKLEEQRERLAGLKVTGAVFRKGGSPWILPRDIALPCATQNELGGDDARALIDNGVTAVVDGANMPSTPDAIKVLRRHSILFGPVKAANAGGVAMSGLEMSQNATRESWNTDEMNSRLGRIMTNIHERCLEAAPERGRYIDYEKGANIAGFRKVADAMVRLRHHLMPMRKAAAWFAW